MVKHGYVGAVCAPHGGPPHFPRNTPDVIADAVDALQRRVDAEGLAFVLSPGSELSLTDGLLDWLRVEGVQALGRAGDACGFGRGAVLFDYWGERWTPMCDAFVDWLLAEGFTPVLAHPERMALVEPWIDLMGRLVERGVLLQGNLRPLTGLDGLMPAYRAEQLLQAERYAMMCLDVHHRSCLDDRLAGVGRLKRAWGRKTTRLMLSDGPRRLLGMAYEDA